MSRTPVFSIFLSGLIAIVATITSCSTGTAIPVVSSGAIEPSYDGSFGTGAIPWTSLEALDGDARFHFVVITDRTGGEREGVFGPAMEAINLMQPAFVVSVGDLIEGYTRDRQQIEAEWDELDGFIKALDAPFFYTPGNHDYSNQVMADVWAERYGPSYYSFVYKEVLFVVLNSALFDREGIEGHGQRFEDWSVEQQAQLSWFEKTLAAHEDVRWTFVLTHRPYWRKSWKEPEEDGDLETPSASGPWPRHEGEVREWKAIERLLDDRDYTAFAGHMHSYEYEPGPGGPHVHEKIALATTGGVSGLRGKQYGEFDHFVWMTMTDEGPVMANVLLDGVLGKDHPMPLRRPYWVPGPDLKPE
ncbi:MAG: metallophosphoesterase [Pseudomonadota bacterium]